MLEEISQVFHLHISHSWTKTKSKCFKQNDSEKDIETIEKNENNPRLCNKFETS